MKKNENMQFINTFTKKYNSKITLLCFLSSISSLSYIALAFFSKNLLELATNNQINSLVFQILWCAIPLVLILLSDTLAGHISTKTSSLLNNTLTRSTWTVLLEKDYSSIFSMHSGDILNRITNDIDISSTNYINFLPNLISSALRIICGLTAIFIIDYAFGLICVSCGFLIAIFVSFTRKYYKQAQKKCLETRASENSFLQESISNIDAVKTLPDRNALTKLLDGYLKENNSSKIARNSILITVNAVVFLAFNISFYCAIIFGAFRLTKDIQFIGSLFALIQLLQLVKSPFGTIVNFVPNFIALFASIERIMLLHNLPQEIANNLECEGFERLELKKLAFSYNETKIFSNLNTTINANEKIAIVGASGCGKSTLAKILVGLLTASDGKIICHTTDGQECAFLPKNIFAYAPQNNFIFSGTIRENLLLANPLATNSQIENACSIACVDEFANTLVDKLDTTIGERGYGLSQGQIQRIALARALISNKPVLILDEVTSALDKAMEEQVWKNLVSIKGKTIIFITHAANLTATCDKILNMENMVTKNH